MIAFIVLDAMVPEQKQIILTLERLLLYWQSAYHVWTGIGGTHNEQKIVEESLLVVI